MRKLNFLVLVLAMSMFAIPVHAQVQFLQEDFGNFGYWLGQSKDYPDWSSDLMFTKDTILIQNVFNNSTGYDIASGSSRGHLKYNDGRDTLTFKYDLAATGFSNIKFGGGFFAYGNVKNLMIVEYSTDSASWTLFDEDNLASGAFGGGNEWGYVIFNETLPNAGTVYLRIINTSGEIFFDDLTLSGDPPADQNPFLSELNLSEGTLDPDFAYNVYDYTVTLPYGTTTAPTVTPVTDIAEATTVVTDVVDVTSADPADRTYTVEVTATDGTTVATYSILFNIMPPATDATLANLAVDGYMLAPGFMSGNMFYIVYLPDTTTVVPDVMAWLSDEDATYSMSPATDLSATESGPRTTSIEVTAEDGVTANTYYITFVQGYTTDDLVVYDIETFGDVGNKFGAYLPDYEGYTSNFVWGNDTMNIRTSKASNGYALASGANRMEVQAGWAATGYDTAVFSMNTLGLTNPTLALGVYNNSGADVGASAAFEAYYSEDSTTWTPFTNTVENTPGDTFPAANSWSYIILDETLPAVADLNILIANQNANFEYYVDDISVWYTPLSPEARLADIAVTEGMLAPTFDPMVKNYVVKIPAGTTETPVITATAWDPNATVNVTDASDVTAQAESARTSVIEVTAADGMHTMTYNVIFTFESVSLTRVPLFREEFGAVGFYIGEAISYPDYSALTIDNLVEGDSAYIRNNNESSMGYDGASGEGFLLMQPPNNWVALNDTFTMKGINIPDAYKDIRISFGTTANTGWGGYRDHNFAMDYSVDGENWTVMKGPGIETLGNDTFPNNDWAWVRLAEDIPVSDNLHIRFYNDEANHQYYIDDFTITGVPLGNEATLSEITVSEGTLDPDFNSATMQYTVLLPNGSTETPTVEVAETDTNATHTIDPATDITSSDIADRTTTITVVAENEMDTEVYTIVFEVEPSDVATLSDMTLAEGTLEPAFSAVTFNYTADLPAGTTSAPAITATPTDPNATVDVTDASDVTSTSAADRTSTIVVTAEDGTTQLTYTVVFEVLVGIYDQYLNNLSIFPNPAHDVMEIRNVSTFSRVEMINIAGQKVKILENKGADRIEMNVSTLDAGVYMLKFYVGNAYAGAKQVMKK